MKVLLISSNVTITPYPAYPLGVSMVAAALTRAGHEVLQSDFLYQKTDLDAVAQEVREFKPDLVGISVRNIDNVNMMNEHYYIQNVKNIVSNIKGVTNKKIVLGGAGFSLMPEKILAETGADYGIVGEGEVLMVEFANNAAKGIYPDGLIVNPTSRMQGEQIGSALYDQRLLEFYLQSGNIASVQTKRGCTHKCVYCTYPLLEGVHLRKREPRAVVDDVEVLRDKFGTKYLFFVDSVFNDDEGSYLQIIDEMIRRNVSIPWTAYFKPGGLDDAIVERMKKTGLAGAEIGSDAACDTTLKKMGKSFTFAQIRESNDIFARHEVATSHFFMFGGPGETKETVVEGINNILQLQKCVVFIFMGIRILPNTPLEKIALRESVITSNDDLLRPIYYVSPTVDQAWMEETLTKAFENVRHCVFPPDKYDNSIQVLHKLGYTGPMWELLVPGKKRERIKHVGK